MGLPLHANGMLPATHIRIVLKEIVTEELYLEGHSSDVVHRALILAEGLWGASTLDEAIIGACEVLPRAAFLRLLAFCNSEYPLLYQTLRNLIPDAVFHAKSI